MVLNSTHMLKKKIIVLGAGLSGLSCAYELSKSGFEVTVIEKESSVGGLARSFKDGDFTCDFGPHRFHSEKHNLLNHIFEVLDGKVVEKIRKSEIFLKNRYFAYPLNTVDVIFKMPVHTLARIFLDYFVTKVRKNLKPISDDSFEKWVINRFGKKLYEIFFKEYTEKTWGLPCSEISEDYASQRITLLNLSDVIIKTIFRTKKVPRTYVSKFFYPEKGGIGAISEAYREKIIKSGNRVLTSTEVCNILTEGNRIHSISYKNESGEHVEEFSHILSTIPLTDLVSLIKPMPEKKIIQACSELFFRSIVFVYLVINRPRLTTNHWIYIPEKKFISNRFSEFKNFNENSSPQKKTIICAEVTCFYGDRIWNMNDERLADRVTEDLVQMKLIGENEVDRYFLCKLKHAYPIYDIYYKEHVGVIKDYLNHFDNLYYFGRNALFRYNNMDHSVEMGLTVAEDIVKEKKTDLRTATERKWFG